VKGRGLHHVTVIATDAARNLEFYTKVLGLRLVKRTVTHEDPGAYHLIYGGGEGAPGGSLSFFSWVSAAEADGPPDGSEYISFSVTPDALDWWAERLSEFGIPFQQRRPLGGSAQLNFKDPDCTPLALVASALQEQAVWSQPHIPPAFAVRQLACVTMSVRGTTLMARILTEVLGYAEIRRVGDQVEFSAHDEAGGRFVLHQRRNRPRPRLGAGVIHHVAFRARDETELVTMAKELQGRFGITASPVKDRYYFQSIYFRGPDGLLIEISTDGPGFLIDETVEDLGSRLIFPPSLEDRQDELLRILPPLDRAR